MISVAGPSRSVKRKSRTPTASSQTPASLAKWKKFFGDVGFRTHRMPVDKDTEGCWRAEQYWIKQGREVAHFGKTARHSIEVCREFSPEIQVNLSTKPATKNDVADIFTGNIKQRCH